MREAHASQSTHRGIGDAQIVPRKRVASPGAASCERAAKSPTAKSVTTTSTVPAMKQRRLLAKVLGGRPTSKVMASAAVGVAAIIDAPKLSEFKEGSNDERVKAHAEAMFKWSSSNLTSKAIEAETRARALIGCRVKKA